MRRLFLSAMLALFAASAGAQSQGQCFFCYWPPAGTGGTWDGGAFTTAATGPTGCTNPAYSFTGDTTAGFCRVGAASVRMQSAASGARGTAGTSSTQADIGFNDAGSAFTGFTFEDDKAVFYASSVAKFQLGASPGTGLLTLRGSTDAIARSIAAGTGVSVSNGDGQSGNPTVGVDTATTPQFSSGTSSASASGSPGTFYFETDAGLISSYSTTNTLATFMTLQTHFIDEDSFASDSATKVPSQQSVKAYVDAKSTATVTENTTSINSTAAQSGVVFTNTGDADGSAITLLNDPTVGVNYSVAVTVAQTITISPSAGETLYLNAVSCANVTSATIGGALSVVAVVGGSGGKWVASGAGWTCN